MPAHMQYNSRKLDTVAIYYSGLQQVKYKRQNIVCFFPPHCSYYYLFLNPSFRLFNYFPNFLFIYLLYFFPTSHQMIEIEYLLWIIEVQNIVTKITTVKTNRPVIYVTDITWNPMFPNCSSPVSILKLLSFIYIPLKNLDISFITME